MKVCRLCSGIVGVALVFIFAGNNLIAAESLVDATKRGNIGMVQELLRAGIDVNESEGDGMTALHWAADVGHNEITDILLFAGANVNAGTRIGSYTPLHIASRKGNAAVVTKLVDANADLHARTTNSGVAPIHLAAASANSESLRILINAGADVNSLERAWGQTPLIFAASSNRAENIRLLLDAGADPSISANVVDVVDREIADKYAEDRLNEVLEEFKTREGGTANWMPQSSQVQAAIDYSREIQRKWPNVPDGHCDSSNKQESAPANKPVDKVDCVKPGNNEGDEPKPPTYGQLVGTWGGLTPLLHAVRQGFTQSTLELLDGGAEVNQPSAGDGTTPLLMATVNGQFDIALILLDKGADSNITSTAGASPLFAVLERRWAPWANYAHPVEHEKQEATHLDILQALLNAGADPNLRLNKHLWYSEYTISVLSQAGLHYAGATPFWRASHALDLDAMGMLKAHGADPNIATVKIPKRQRRSRVPDPMDEKEEGEGEGEGIAAAKESVAKTNQDVPGDSEEKDYSGLPPVTVGGPFIYPIHAASGAGYGQSFAANAHRHAPDSWLPAVKFLVEECGAEVDLRDGNGYTALHHAASRGDNEMIKYLVGRGADVTVVSRKGQTTADMANGPIQRVSPFPDTIALLVELGAKNNNNCVSC